MVKRTIQIVMLAFAIYARTVIGAPDYSEFTQSVTNFFNSLDQIVKQLPSANTATGTVQIIDAWSAANERFAEAGERFTAKYPEVLKMTEPVPELTAAYRRTERLKTDYQTLVVGVQKLLRRFGEAPEVRKALARFERSLARIDSAGGVETRGKR